MPRSMARKKGNTLKPGKLEKDGEENHPEGEENFHDERAALLPTGSKEEVPFEEKVSSDRMRNKKIPLDSRDRKMKQ